jgi:probable phosphoglycerate mutase
MIRLALLRHGHTAWNRAGRIQGRTDIPLDEDTRQALKNCRLPGMWKDAELWSSPLARARETAALITGQKAQTTPALTEMDWGDWEGQRGHDLRDDPDSGYRDIEAWGWKYTPPNGESPACVLNRLIPWINSLTADTVAVCHIGIMRVLLAQATGWAFDGPAPFQIKRNRLYIIEIAEDGWQWTGEPLRLEKAVP